MSSDPKPNPKREPRPAGKPRSSKATGSYEHWKAEWERRRAEHGGGDWIIDKPELQIDVAPFLATLRQLGYQTQDRRFHELARVVFHSDLIDRTTGKWSRHGSALANPITRDVCEMLEEAIASGVSEREALAEIAAAYCIAGASFDAVVKRLRRLLVAYRKTVGHKPA